MDQLKVATGAKSLVHDPPGERRFQERLARGHAIKGVLDGLPVVVRQLLGTTALQDIDGKPGDHLQRTMHHNLSLRPAAPSIPHCRRSPRAGRPWSGMIGLMSSRRTFS